MRAAHTMLQVGGRRLLSDCTVLGSVGTGGSIAILLLIGFVLGGATSWLFFWWRQRRVLRIELEYRDRYGDAVKHGLPDVTAMVKAAHTPTIRRGGSELAPLGSQLPNAAAGMGEGPLAMGANGSLKRDPLAQALSFKQQQHGTPAADTMLRSSSGNPFAGEVPSFNVVKNGVCSLNNTPSPTGRPDATPDGQQPTALIGTNVFAPATDPDSPRITKPAPGPPSASPAGAGYGWPGAAAKAVGGEGEEEVQGRMDSVVVKGVPPSADAQATAGAGASDYLAALHSTATNAFEAPRAEGAAATQPAGGDAKAAQKQQLLRQVTSDEFGEDDLDEEWASLLAELDSRLQAAGRPSLSARERAVAIRSLIVATSSQSADAALAKAMHDVEGHRRVQALRGAA